MISTYTLAVTTILPFSLQVVTQTRWVRSQARFLNQQNSAGNQAKQVQTYQMQIKSIKKKTCVPYVQALYPNARKYIIKKRKDAFKPLGSNIVRTYYDSTRSSIFDYQ